MSRVLSPFGGRLRGSNAGTAVVEFVAASMRQRKPVVAFADPGHRSGAVHFTRQGFRLVVPDLRRAPRRGSDVVILVRAG
jgi:hypothetical protein